MNLTQQRYLGFLHTPFLWDTTLASLTQATFSESTDASINVKIPDTIRLGNYVEQLVSYYLRQIPGVKVLAENVQIIQHKETLGELDCLLLHNKAPIHLEIAYKFYLYDPSAGPSFLECWIGPNRRDSLVLKLAKTKNKQFPLIHHEACKAQLAGMNIASEAFVQNTFFKGQLFLPLGMKPPKFEGISSDAVAGTYCSFEQITQFTDCKFYLPKKLDWLIVPHTEVAWINYNKICERIQTFFVRNSSPLVWIKFPNGVLKKMFITWW